MARKDEILDELAELAQKVTHARESLLKGELVPLGDVQAQIEAQCQAIVDLEPDDTVEIKPKLDDLLDNMRLFSEEVEYVQAKVAEILRNAEQAEKDGQDNDS